MIIVKLIGGLGNQMFQYSAGYALANKHNTAICIDILFLLDKSKRHYRHTHRDYALDIFNISGSLALTTEISKHITPRIGNNYFYHLKKRLHRSWNTFSEKKISGHQGFFELPNDSYIEGYFQDPSYFIHLEESIRKEFDFKEPLPEFCTPIKDSITSNESICIIFRRGDYVNHPELDILTLDFYNEAIQLIKKKINDPYLFVFSDDIEWCKDNFRSADLPVCFVDQKYTGPKAQNYLQLITLCNHFIIPNSTFAWWGAWLSQTKDKIVIAPKKWHKSQVLEVNNIIPPGWIAI